MSKVIVDMAISLDGFVATADGRDGGLHDYFFKPSTETSTVIERSIQSTGAIIMGRRAYDLGVEHGGFADDPYGAAHLVVTHPAPATRAPGAETFVFVTDGIESALQRARACAGGKDVVIGGGASVAQQFLRAGHVEEIHLHVVPRALVNGMRLFDSPVPHMSIDPTRVVAAADALHVVYVVERDLQP